MVVAEVGGSTPNQLPFKRATKRHDWDVTLTAVKSENKLDLQHFAGHKEAQPPAPPKLSTVSEG